MPLLRLIAEGVGPFEKLDLDLSDGKGNPHLGPHILAGVNGSGKSTVLKAIVWVLDRDYLNWGFDRTELGQSLAGHKSSDARFTFKTPSGSIGKRRIQTHRESENSSERRAMDAPVDEAFQSFYPVAAYAPSPKLKYLSLVDTTRSLSSPFEYALAFGETVRNDLVQSYLTNLLSKPRLAQDERRAGEYAQALKRVASAVSSIYENDRLRKDDQLRLVLKLEPGLHPEIQFGEQTLNFSQLPDGIRTTIGWLADFMMRQDLMQWDPQLEGKRPGLLLLDEIDAHLHPQWQRTLLPAIRKALPDVQIIVTSHSPFVINSCPGSRVHVFDRYDNGQAYLKQSCDAPVGHSVMATLKDIFGIESRFDVRTEKELNEWHQLSRREAVGPLPDGDRQRKEELTRVLSERSESLKAIVFRPTGLSAALRAQNQEKAG